MPSDMTDYSNARKLGLKEYSQNISQEETAIYLFSTVC